MQETKEMTSFREWAKKHTERGPKLHYLIADFCYDFSEDSECSSPRKLQQLLDHLEESHPDRLADVDEAAKLSWDLYQKDVLQVGRRGND